MQLEVHGPIAILRMNEGKANAMNPAFIHALDHALNDVEQRAPKALVLTGDGRHFCAGLDLATLNAAEPAEMTRFLEVFERVLMRVFLMPRPVVAAVNGNAIAGGCILAGAADVRVAASGEYRVGVNEARIGVSFPSAALEIPRAQLAPAQFRKAILEGDLMSPHEALALGLLDELVPPERLLDVAVERATKLTRAPTAAFAQVKREMRAPYVERVEAHGEQSRDAFQELWYSNEAVRLRAEVLGKSKA
jgi:enoyl-CoA hydratase